MRIGKFISLAAFLFSMLFIMPSGEAAEETATLSFLTIGSYDGQLSPDEASGQVGVARFAAAVKEQQRQAKGAPLFVSTGNMLAGTLESELTEGFALISVFNDLKLDVMGIGTGDLKWPSELLAKQAAMARYAYVGLEMIMSPEKKQLSDSYKLIKCGGIKVGFLAVNRRDFSDGILSADNVLAGSERIQTYITELHNEKAELIVLVTDITSVTMIKALLDNLAGIDIVIADTASEEAGQIGQTLLISAGQGGNQLCRTDIELSKDSRKITAVKTERRIISAGDDTDMVYEAFLNRVAAKVSFLKQQELGRTQQELWHNPSGTSLLAQFAADTVQTAAEADAALIFGGELGGGLKKGAITQGDMYRIFPLANEAVIARFSGAQLRQILYEGLSRNLNGIIMFAGLRVCYDDNKLGLGKLAVTLADGSEVDDEQLYRVVLSQQVYQRYGGLLAQEEAEFTGRSWRSYIQEAVRDAALTVSDDQRLMIIPYQLSGDI